MQPPDPYAVQPTQPAYTYPTGPAGAYPPAGPAYAQAPGTNTLAIVALVLAFVFWPAAIVCGHIARRQIKQTGEQGDGLALAAIILGYVALAILVVFCGIGTIGLIASSNN
jgi:hypothetical protein